MKRDIFIILITCLLAAMVAAAQGPRPCTQWTIAVSADTTWYEIQCVQHVKLIAEADTVIPLH